MGADLVGSDHEALVLDRPRPDQHLPVVPRGRERERTGNHDHLCASNRDRPVELRKAKVVADGHSEASPSGELREHHFVAGLLVVGLGVDNAVDLYVEHVDLAVRGPYLSVRADVDAGVGALLLPRQALHDRTRDQLDSQLACGSPRPPDALAVEWLRARYHLLVRSEHAPFLGQDDELGPSLRGLADEAVGGGEIVTGVLGRVELYGGGAHSRHLSSDLQDVSPDYPGD